MKKVAVLMGSDSDFEVMKKGINVLNEFGVEYEVHVYSAHRTPNFVEKFSKEAKEKGFGVIICGAGMAAALAGVVAGNTTLPVIGVPLSGGSLKGMDALLATSMMPSGVPVACVAIDGSKNAAYLAMQILALSDEELSQKLIEHKQKMRDEVLKKDIEVQNKVKELWG